MNTDREIVCHVCGDKASGKHYGVPSCDGCRGFFKRSIRRNLDYSCKEGGNCIIDVTRRNQCQACRFAKCLRVNMKRDAVQHERAPRTFIMPIEEFSHQNLDLPSVIQSTMPSYPSMHYSHLHTLGYSFNSAVKFRIDSHPYGNENEVTSSEEIQNQTYENDGNCLINSKFTISTSIYESACKVLFLALRWTRSIPSFFQLNSSDQVSLLTESWNELFILNAVQWSFSFSLDDGLSDNERDIRSTEASEFQKKLREIILRFNYLQVDYTEFACLKALILFKPESKNLQNRLRVELLQDQTQLMLHEYCITKQSTRFGKLLLLLSSVSSFTKHNLEEMFFNQLSGNVNVQAFILDMLH